MTKQTLYTVTLRDVDYNQILSFKSLLINLQINKYGEDWERIEQLLHFLDSVSDKIDEKRRTTLGTFSVKVNVPLLGQLSGDFIAWSEEIARQNAKMYYADNFKTSEQEIEVLSCVER